MVNSLAFYRSKPSNWSFGVQGLRFGRFNYDRIQYDRVIFDIFGDSFKNSRKNFVNKMNVTKS